MRAQWQVFHIWLSRYNYKRWSSLLHQFFKFEISLWNILSWYLQIVSSQIYFPFGCNLKTANSTFMNLDKILFSYIYMGRISGCGQGSLKPWVPHRLRPANSPQKGSWPGKSSEPSRKRGWDCVQARGEPGDPQLRGGEAGWRGWSGQEVMRERKPHPSYQ